MHQEAALKCFIGALCIALGFTGPALSQPDQLDAVTLTCSEYSKVDSFGINVIPSHRRQDLAVFVLGYAVGEAKLPSLKDDRIFSHAADALDMLCADAKLAKLTLIEVVKQYGTLDGVVVTPKP